MSLRKSLGRRRLPTERIRLNVDEGVTPREHAAQYHHHQSCGIMRPACLHLPLLKQRELFSQIQVLGCQCAARPRREHEETDEIVRYERQRGEAVSQRTEDETGHKCLASHFTRRYVSANAGERDSCGPQAVLVRVEQRSLRLRVWDNGNGIYLETADRGHGLRSMRQRATGIGGEIQISSHPGQGTSVDLSVPLRRRPMSNSRPSM
jgi:hypothetical protein